MLCGYKTWAVKDDDTRLVHAGNSLVRWMNNAAVRGNQTSEELKSRLEIKCISNVIRTGRPGCFVRVERKNDND